LDLFVLHTVVQRRI